MIPFFDSNKTGQTLGWKTACYHHYMHHQCSGGNYGLCFRFWDRHALRAVGCTQGYTIFCGAKRMAAFKRRAAALELDGR